MPSIEQQLKLRDFDHPGSQGIFVKAGTPRPIVDRLSEAVNKVLGMPEVAAKALEAAGAELAPSTPDQLADLVRSDIRKFTEAVRVSGAKAQ